MVVFRHSIKKYRRTEIPGMLVFCNPPRHELSKYMNSKVINSDRDISAALYI